MAAASEGLRTLLPLPIARLCRRSLNAKSPKDRHDHAWFAFEASVKLAVAASPPRDCARLARGSLGTWAAALRPPEMRLEAPALLALHQLLGEIGEGSASPRKTVGARELFGLFGAYRNHTIGHASVRDAEFYERAGRILLDGLEAAWGAGLFLHADARLAFVDTIGIGSGGARRARVVDLASENALAESGIEVPDTIEPRRVVLRTGSTWQSLHPWILYREEPEGLWCVNGLARQAEFLDYAAGAFLRGSAAEELAPGITAELRALFGGSAQSRDEEESAPGARGAPGVTGGAARKELGGFELVGELGRGGMGVVYLARQPVLRRWVALKTLPAAHAENATARARFEREVRALARCEHPNVVKVLASGEEGGTLWFAMECVLGADLRGVLEARRDEPDFARACVQALEHARRERARALPELEPEAPANGEAPRARPRAEDRGSGVAGAGGWSAFARFFCDAARGVAHLHERGVLHRDLSPANLMVNAGDGRAVIMDLGLAAVEDASVTLTRDQNQILGTLRYLAPDQFTRKVLELDGRADVYSLGAVMHEVAAGTAVFDGETEARLMRQILAEEPVPLRTLRADVPRELEAVVLQALEKRREDRQASMEVLAGQLDAIAHGRVPVVPRLKRSYRVRKALARRSRWLAAAGVLVGGAAVGAFVWPGTGAAGDAPQLPVREPGSLSAAQVQEVRKLADQETRARIDALLRLQPSFARSESVPLLPGGRRPDFGGTRSPSTRPGLAPAAVAAREQAARALAEAAVPREPARASLRAALEAVLAVPIEQSEELREALYDLGSRALELDLLPQARRAWERLQVMTADAGVDDPLRLHTLESLGWCLHLLGDDAGARPKLEEVLAALEGQWPDVPRTQRVRLKLAEVLEGLGELARARELVEQALAVLGTNAKAPVEDRLAAGRALARIALALGDTGGARARLETLRAELATADGGGADLLTDLDADLARVLYADGDQQAARDLFEQVLADRSRSLPADHRDVLRAKQDLGIVLADLGEESRARELQEQVLAVLADRVPSGHPDRLAAETNLAITLARSGDLEGACALFEGVFLTLGTEQMAAGPREVQEGYSPPPAADVGNPDLPLRETGPESGARRNRPSDADLHAARSNVAIVLVALGEHEKAMGYIEEVVRYLESTLPDDHPELQAARRALAAALSANREHARARELLERVLEVEDRTLPRDHPDTLRTRADLARTLRLLGEEAHAVEVEEGRWP